MRDVAGLNYKLNLSLSQCIPRRYLVEMEVSVVKENKKIIFDGYAFTVHYNLVSSIRWKCSNKISKKCPGILVTSNNYKNPTIEVEHSHADDANLETVEKAKAEMLKRVSTFSTSTPSQIFAEVINQEPDLTSFANEETTKRMLRSKKKKRIKKYDKFITPIFCLLQNKIRSTYEEMFTAIFNKCFENNVYPDTKIMNMDFEQAVIQAAKTVIGEHLIIQGCFYHLCQSTHKKLQELGLQNKYNHDNVFSHYCCMIDGLAFLPVQKVIEGMKYLKSICAPDNKDILDYFYNTY
ncbi:MULE domain-containing protein [Aphis craccivora]|uniref:MULE domain-containing protein n=1 Tax=Aphis craccivora TaxID=307492 RepID=A0A6G0Y3D2_APHCR|nr:MULE domain-containing protein [Aphis craccivora]